MEVSRWAIEVGGDRRLGDTKAHSRSFSASGELRKHLAAEATEEEKQAIADAPVGQLREQYGVDQTKVMPVIQDRWDSEEEATVLATFSQQGVAPEAVKEMYSWWVSLFNGALGDAHNLDLAATESEFRAIAKRPSTTSSGS